MSERWTVHLVYIVDQQPSWNADEITSAWQRVRDALNYWNQFNLPVHFELEDNRLWESIGVPGIESRNFDGVTQWADSQHRLQKTVYLLHDSAMLAAGFARKGEYALCIKSSIEGDLIHELGHLLGANDHREWAQSVGWYCTTEIADPMGTGTATPTLSWQTMLEICSYLQPQTGWQWIAK